MTSCALLVDDRVDRDGGLAGLAVADDQLALAAADRDHRVDGLDAGLERLVDGLALDDARRLDSIGAVAAVSIGPLPSIGWPSGLTTRPRSASPTGTCTIRPVVLDTVSFSLILRSLAEQHGADVVLLEVRAPCR